MATAGVLGASGYAGTELLGILAGHGQMELVVAGAHRSAGITVAQHQPSLAPAYLDLVMLEASPESVSGLDVVFLALPHGESQQMMRLFGPEQTIIDLSADFRTGAKAYEHWYGSPHQAAELCDEFVTGVVERSRKQLQGAKRIAVPGCYPTASTLALGPLLDRGLIESSGIVIDAVSGVSGAGRSSAEAYGFSQIDEDFKAYGLFDHRHTGEIQDLLNAEVIFTPHLAPMVRGMLVTCYARPKASVTADQLQAAMREAYQDEAFVTLTHHAPSTKWTAHSNAAFVWVGLDERTGWVVAMAAIDNLGKGAAGQAVQAANVALGFSETEGLSTIGSFP
ncbi:MAG: N-acetyl-gamma-glutamyl-phosphate reductase [Actinomycetes bacterium]